MGLVEPYKATSPAEGRSAVTGKDADASTSGADPAQRRAHLSVYFHDGEAATLEQAVDTWAVCSSARSSRRRNASIVAF